MHGYAADTHQQEQYARQSTRHPVTWTRDYQYIVAVVDFTCAAATVAAAAELRFDGDLTPAYLGLSLVLPFLWVVALRLAGAYDVRFFGTGPEEFRKVLAAGVSVTAGIAMLSYVVNTEVSRGYMIISLPSATVLDLLVRYAVRKRLHRMRSGGRCMSAVVVAGPEAAVADLIVELRRDRYHGLTVVAACVARWAGRPNIADVPIFGGLGDVAAAVRSYSADAVAVLACPEIDAVRLRGLAWELEKTGTDLCVAPALLDVAGPRTTIRQTAGLTLLHVDHPQLTGFPLFVKGLFDRCVAALALLVLSPVFGSLALAIRVTDRGPALFTQRRVGKDGRGFTIYKFRTMVVDAEQRRARLLADNELDGVLFKLRRDPRVTRVGAALRRWSADELPQLLNVVRGDMSLVGPRPALPDEAEQYADHVRRRLVVKPGMTGLWQVNGRSELSWEESVRLDLRYVENWSFTLDMQILWKTISVIFHGRGAY
jgi:exopolysaccharide biosynthesis polyprenyl glycosylphosphotransferase